MGQTTSEFEQDWKSCEAALYALLCRMLRDCHLADEALAATAAKCWRGYATFQRRSTFFSWAVTIARREGLRLLARRKFDALSHTHEPAAPAEPESPETACGLADAIARAREARYVTAQSAVMLRSRLAMPDASWSEIGMLLGLSANSCAVAHLRAILDLRVYLFVCEPVMLGGRREIERAFAAAQERSVDPLTPAQAAAFESAVLASGESRRYRSQLLRQACARVAAELGKK